MDLWDKSGEAVLAEVVAVPHNPARLDRLEALHQLGCHPNVLRVGEVDSRGKPFEVDCSAWLRTAGVLHITSDGDLWLRGATGGRAAEGSLQPSGCAGVSVGTMECRCHPDLV